MDREKRKKALIEQAREIEKGFVNPYQDELKMRKPADEEVMEDILNFKDSDRDSLLSYI